MSKYLITASLINSFSYYMKDKWKSPADSRADFLKTLSRERFEANEAMQKGIDFENDIERACKDGWQLQTVFEDDIADKYEACVYDIMKIVKGGIWQATCSKDLQINDKSFVLYGRCDVVKANMIYDIKFTGKYELGKFSDSIQHLIYMFCLDMPKFAYLVSDGKNFWREDYVSDNPEADIRTKISGLLDYLERDKEASDIFYDKWKSKH